VKLESGDEFEFLFSLRERLLEPFEIQDDVVIPTGAYSGVATA
jgi:hypothetical protein